MSKTAKSWRAVLVTAVAAAAVTLFVFVPAGTAAPARVAVHHATSHATQTPNCKRHPKGSATWSDWEFPANVSPYQGSGAASGEISATYLESLETVNQNGQLIPQMLTKLPKPHGLTVYASIRPNMHWSDGRTITNKDVKFGWLVGMNASQGTPWCAGACDVIKSIGLRGKYGLVFHLKHTFAPFLDTALWYLPVWPTSWPGGWKSWDVKQATYKLFGDTKYTFTNPSYPTNGPFQVTGFYKNQRIEMHPMKYYNIETCSAGIENLTFAGYNSKDDMIAGAAQHATDITTDYTQADLKKLNTYRSEFKTLIGPEYTLEHLEFNVDKTYNGQPNPVHDVRVRDALALAVDKTGLIRAAMGVSPQEARGMEAWQILIKSPHFTAPFADKNITGQWDMVQHKYVTNTGHGQALADAKKLLAEAGYKNGFSIDSYTTEGNPTRQAEFEVIQNNWAQIGVKMNPKYIPSSTLFGSWSDGAPCMRGTFQMEMWGAGNGPDPDSLKYEFQSQYIDRLHKIHNVSNDNCSGIQNKYIDEAFNKGADTYNIGKRTGWYNLFQQQVNKNAYWIPLWYWDDIETTDGRVTHFYTNPEVADQWNSFAWTVRNKKGAR